MIADYLLEELLNLGVGVAKSKINKKIDEQRLKKDLEEFIISEKKYFDLSSIDEEFDFEGLLNYVVNNLIEDTKTSVFSKSRKEREKAHQTIINKGLQFSQADTEESKDKVNKLITNCINIIRNFYKKQITIKEYLLCSETLDDGIENITDKIDESRELVLSSQKELAEYSSDNFVRLVNNNQLNLAETKINNLFNTMSTQHKLYPEYGYSMNQGKLMSVPLQENSIKKYPPIMDIKADLQIGEYINYFNGFDPLDFSYRHQLDMIIQVKDARKLLGSIEDPCQSEAERMIGENLVLKHKEFPPAFPCSIKVGGKTYFEYVLLRTKEILDDGTYIVTNDEQGHAKVNFEFRFKVEGETLFNFTFHTKNLNSKEHLNYSRFLKDIVMKKEFLIYSLKRQIEIVRAQGYQEVDYDASLIDIEIDLYTRLCLIEEYFNVEFEIPDIITQDDSKIIFTLSDLINSKDSHKSWKNSTLSIRVESSVKQSFVDFEKPIQLVIDGEGNVELFGQILKFRHRGVYKTARMRDYERISQMIHLLKGDETIPVKFDPGEDDTYYDIIQRID
mgnify:CR=1 FL=1